QRGRLDRRRLLRSAYGHPRALLLHRDFRDAGFLDDAYDFADPLGARLVDAPAEETVLAARPVANRAQERLRLLAEQGQQQELLLACRETFRLVADVVENDGLVRRRRVPCDQRDCTLPGCVDLARRRSEAPLEQVAKLVDDGLVARRGQDVDDRLRTENLADRSGYRRRAGFAPDDCE